jgi:hypothetical protein
LSGEPAAGRVVPDDLAAWHGRQADIDWEALEALRWHWGEAYEIGRDDTRGWRARRRDGLGGDITAGGPDDLRQAIRGDYAVKAVPRDPAAAIEGP